jgi:hypothetical protein
VLHLVDPSGPGGGPCTLKAAAELISAAHLVRHDVLVVGSASHAALARRCGLRPRGRLGAPLNQPALALGALRGLLRGERRGALPHDLVHAWTLRGAVAALRAGGRRVLVTPAAAGPLGHGDRARLRRAEVIALGPGAAGVLESHGIRARGTLGAAPRVDVDPGERGLIREAWGADETCLAVGLLGDPPGGADGEFAINAAGRAALAGRDVRLVLHHASAPPGGLRRRLRRLGLGRLVVVDDRIAEPWRIASALDAALFATRRGTQGAAGRWWGPPGLADPWRHAGPPTLLPLVVAMAAGVPLIAARHAGVAELLEDGSSALLCRPGDFNEASAAILSLFGDRAARRRIGAAARRCVEDLRLDDAAARLVDAYWGGGSAGKSAAAGSVAHGARRGPAILVETRPGHERPSRSSVASE